MHYRPLPRPMSGVWRNALQNSPLDSDGWGREKKILSASSLRVVQEQVQVGVPPRPRATKKVTSEGPLRYNIYVARQLALTQYGVLLQIPDYQLSLMFNFQSTRRFRALRGSVDLTLQW